MYIPKPEDVPGGQVGCDGVTVSSSSRTVAECRTCQSCPDGQIKVSGCNGTTTDPLPVCASCENCRQGQYVQKSCEGGIHLNVTCANCTRQCSAGYYFVRGCTGNSVTQVKFPSTENCSQNVLMYDTPVHACMQDLVCRECSACAPGFYINRSCPGGNLVTNDTHQCARCKTQCPAGFFPHGLCDGTSLNDTVACKRCDAVCPAAGTYMHATCNGSSSKLDCRPCIACPKGTFLSGGSCAGGNGTDPEDVQCTACKRCSSNARLLNACNGRSLLDTVQCENCPSCQPGFFINRSCDGMTSTTRMCAPCKTCNPGFYRMGCATGNTVSDDVRCMPCANCSIGSYIESLCDGNGFSSMANTTCTNCPPCSMGQYVSKQCTGSSIQKSDSQCRDCASMCPSGSYVQEGCMGTGSMDSPRRCQLCNHNCGDNSYLVSTCSGQNSFEDYQCTECTCPDGLPPVKKCTDMKLNHVCTSGCVGAACMPSLSLSLSPESNTQTSSANSATRTAPETTPAGEKSADEEDKNILYIVAGVTSSFAIMFIAALLYCFFIRKTAQFSLTTEMCPERPMFERLDGFHLKI